MQTAAALTVCSHLLPLLDEPISIFIPFLYSTELSVSAIRTTPNPSIIYISSFLVAPLLPNIWSYPRCDITNASIPYCSFICETYSICCIYSLMLSSSLAASIRLYTYLLTSSSLSSPRSYCSLAASSFACAS